MKSDVTLYLNADQTKVVLEGDKDAAFLLVRAGGTIPDPEITRRGEGLLVQARQLAKGNAEPETEEKKAVAAPPEDKAVTAPEENKSAPKAGSRKAPDKE